MLAETPERLYLYIYTMWGNYSSFGADFYINSFINYVLPVEVRQDFITEDELISLGNLVNTAAWSTTFELKDGTFAETSAFEEEVALDFEDTESTYWNGAEDVLAALNS